MPNDEREISLRDLAIFLTALGRDLPKYLENPGRIHNHPRAKVWINAALNLGVIGIEESRIIVKKDSLRALMARIREVFSEWISSLS